MTAHAPADEALLRGTGTLNLAHVGDAVYELLVRTYIARRGPLALNAQHRDTIAFVAAPAQAAAMERLLPHLDEEERAVYRRGKNVRVHGCPPGCTLPQYHAATALEALFGWLWLAGRTARLEELFRIITEDDHAA